MNIYGLDIFDILIILFCTTLIGMGKAGLKGSGTVAIPLMAAIFGGKLSTGIILPFLIFADIFAVSYYKRHAEWKYILKVMPWAFGGIAVATFVGNRIEDSQFKFLIGIILIASIALMFWRDIKGKSMHLPDKIWFYAFMGLAGGFATMIGNAAGPIFTIFLLATGMPKNSFIGTGAWVFLIINLSKAPLHIFVWNTITLDSFLLNLLFIPGIAAGAFLGFRLVKIIPEKPYRVFVIVITLVSSVLLII